MYLKDLGKAMSEAGASTIDDYLLDVRSQRDNAGGDPVLAGFLNTPSIVKETQDDPRYTQAKNQMVPKRINSHLVVFDCITCNKCIPVCPNDANFLYETPKVDQPYRDLEIADDGQLVEVGEQKLFEVARTQQIANFADYCNHCGNCDTFCPEYDGPYLKKPSFFGTMKAFEQGAPHDGFHVIADPAGLTLIGRMEGATCRLDQLDPEAQAHRYNDGEVSLLIDSSGPPRLEPSSAQAPGGHRIDIGRYLTMKTLLHGITSSSRVHAVNAPLLGSTTVAKA